MLLNSIRSKFSLCYNINTKRKGGPQIRSGRSGQEKYITFSAPTGKRNVVVQPVAYTD